MGNVSSAERAELSGEIEGLRIVSSSVPILSDKIKGGLDPKLFDPEMLSPEELKELDAFLARNGGAAATVAALSQGRPVRGATAKVTTTHTSTTTKGPKPATEDDLNRLFVRRFMHRDIFTTYESPANRMIPEDVHFAEQYLLGRDAKPARFSHQNRQRRLYRNGKVYEPTAPGTVPIDSTNSNPSLQKKRSISQMLVSKNAITANSKPEAMVEIKRNSADVHHTVGASPPMASPVIPHIDMTDDIEVISIISDDESEGTSSAGYYSPPTSSLDDHGFSPSIPAPSRPRNDAVDEPLMIPKKRSTASLAPRPAQPRSSSSKSTKSKGEHRRTKSEGKVRARTKSKSKNRFSVGNLFRSRADDSESEVEIGSEWVPPIPSMGGKGGTASTVDLSDPMTAARVSSTSISSGSDFDFLTGKSPESAKRPKSKTLGKTAPAPLREYNGRYVRNSVINLEKKVSIEGLQQKQHSTEDLVVNTGIPPKVPPHRVPIKQRSNSFHNTSPQRSSEEEVSRPGRSAVAERGSEVYTRQCTYKPRASRPKSMVATMVPPRLSRKPVGNQSQESLVSKHGESGFMLSGYENDRKLQVVNPNFNQSTADSIASAANDLSIGREQMTVLPRPSRSPNRSPNRPIQSCYDRIGQEGSESSYHYGLEMLTRGSSKLWKNRGDAFLSRMN